MQKNIEVKIAPVQTCFTPERRVVVLIMLDALKEQFFPDVDDGEAMKTIEKALSSTVSRFKRIHRMERDIENDSITVYVDDEDMASSVKRYFMKKICPTLQYHTLYI